MSRRMLEMGFAGLVCAALAYFLQPIVYRLVALDPALAQAVRRWDARQVTALVVRGANANLKLETTPPNPYYYSPFSVVISAGDAASVRTLLSHGADPNEPGPEGLTPLMLAMRQNDAEMAEALLRAGANLNARDHDGKTPLIWLASTIGGTRSGRVAAARLALKWGAELDVVVNDYTATAYAEEVGDRLVAEVLKRAGGRDRSACLDAIADKGPLYAVRSGRLGAVKRLVARGISFNVRGADGSNPLATVVGTGNDQLLGYMLNHGRDSRVLVNAAERDGKTPLMSAAIGGRLAAAKLLLAAGARLDDRDNEGRTALWWADWRQHRDVGAFLRQAGARG